MIFEKSDFNITTPLDIYRACVKVESINAKSSDKKLLKPTDYVWDEEWSVKKNREYTEQYNATITATIDQKRLDYLKSKYNLSVAIQEYIMDQFSSVAVSRAQATFIWDWCVNQFDTDAYSHIDSIVELIETFTEQGEDSEDE